MNLQLEIQFFWPLTEQIPLDLDYSECNQPKLSVPSVPWGSIGPSLSDGTGYTFRVYATNSVGDGSNSSASNSITPSPIVPNAPTIGSAVATGATTAYVTYTAPTYNGGATITSYTAVSTPGSITGTLSQAGSGSINITGLTNNTSYSFVVYATNSAGNSSNSLASNNITTNLPNPPTIGVATQTGATTATVTFTAPTFNGGSTIIS
jgi:hypothetical protein